MKLLLDSVILIDHLNGLPDATAYLRESWQESAISVVTLAEVLCGYPPNEQRGIVRFLERFDTLGIDREVADLAARLRYSHGWKLPDAFQAALAQLHNLRLVTRNTKDFPPSRHSFVATPYKL